MVGKERHHVSGGKGYKGLEGVSLGSLGVPPTRGLLVPEING